MKVDGGDVGHKLGGCQEECAMEGETLTCRLAIMMSGSRENLKNQEQRRV
jgi:hypothetical protein